MPVKATPCRKELFLFDFSFVFQGKNGRSYYTIRSAQNTILKTSRSTWLSVETHCCWVRKRALFLGGVRIDYDCFEESVNFSHLKRFHVKICNNLQNEWASCESYNSDVDRRRRSKAFLQWPNHVIIFSVPRYISRTLWYWKVCEILVQWHSSKKTKRKKKQCWDNFFLQVGNELDDCCRYCGQPTKLNES